MGIYHTKKVLLMDERDFTNGELDPTLDLDDLEMLVSDTLSDHVGSEEYGPILEFLGVVSERHNATHFEPSDFTADIIQPRWTATLEVIASRFGGLDDEDIKTFLQLGTTRRLKQGIKKKLTAAVEREDYLDAADLLSCLQSVADTGFPGIQSDRDLSCGGDDGAYDIRHKHHDPGTRLTAEYAVAWP